MLLSLQNNLVYYISFIFLIYSNFSKIFIWMKGPLICNKPPKEPEKLQNFMLGVTLKLKQQGMPLNKHSYEFVFTHMIL